MAGIGDLPTELLCEILNTYADVGDGDFGDNGGGGGSFVSAWPGKRICRIEVALSLFRLRRVCRRWRDAIQSDRVARPVFGACLPVTDLVPDTYDRSSSDADSGFVHVPYAWCRLFDSSMVLVPEDPWESYEDDPNRWDESKDALGALWRKPLYRQPPVCHWRCGRVTAAASLSDNDNGGGKIRADDDHHVGECAPPGGWFDLLFDTTFMDWIYAKIADNVEDDHHGGYYEPHPSLPVMFSNQCAAVLDVLRNSTAPFPTTSASPIEPVTSSSPTSSSSDPDDDTPPFRNVTLDTAAPLSRRIFDIATASAYVPDYPLRVYQLAAANGCADANTFVDLDRKNDTQWANRRGVPAASLCAEKCDFCCAAEAGKYTDVNGRHDLGDHRYRCGWLLDKLVQRCSSGGGTRGDGGTDVLLFGVDVNTKLDDITRHAYVFVVHPRTGRLFGVTTWFTLGCGP
ncbi:hypothetical protein HK405_001760 [Cladochytrium tenue]|nr:hypothetical protein HK405_001760 [Cladochytrium tenue]